MDQLRWLKIFFELVQQASLLSFLAYAFAKWPTYKNQSLTGNLSSKTKMGIVLLFSLLAIVWSLFDLARYGKSTWLFFDIQLILTVSASVLGGPWGGSLIGLILAGFRLKVTYPDLIYPIIIAGAGFLADLITRKNRDFEAFPKMGFMAGLLAGLFHGLMIYVPRLHLMSPSYFIFTLLCVMFFEAIGIFVFTGVVTMILKEAKRRQIETELFKTKILFLQAQINPHFLLNALTTIAAICGRQKDEGARNLIEKLSHFLRGSLKREEDYVKLREEIHHVQTYLDIEKARWGERLRYEIQSDIRESLWDMKLPILILQPLVENAIKHGVSKKEAGGHVKIKLSEEKNCLKAEIQDDGFGVDFLFIQEIIEGKRRSKEGTGIGVKNIHQRLLHLYGKDYGLKYEAMQQGTKVIVKIPIK